MRLEAPITDRAQRRARHVRAEIEQRGRSRHGEQPDRLRIAFLVYRGNPRSGGQGVYTRHLTGELAALGHRVTVFSGQPYPVLAPGVELVPLPSLDLYRDEDAFRWPHRRELSSITDLVEFTTMRLGGFGEPRAFSWRAEDELTRRRDDFDLVHDDQCLGSGILQLQRSGWPVIASIHHPITIDRSLDLAEAASVGRRLVLRRWYGFSHMQSRVARRLERIITVSNSSRVDIETSLGVDPTRIAVVPIGVDPRIYRPYPEVARIAGRIIAVASADVALKGLVPLLEAVAILRRLDQRVHLVVVSRPKQGGAALSAVARLGLSSSVEFVADESDEQIAARYATASVAAVPSLYEGFSLPAIEAMACGVPLVATTGGALPEVAGCDGESALLVPPGAPAALASALRRVLEDSNLAARLGAAGRARALERFTWKKSAIGTVDQYRSLLANRPC